MPDLKRVFQYHGAEHKTINALEAGAELTPTNVQKFSLIHPRCGTAFLLWVMVIGIFVFALVGRPVWYWLIASRILLLPVIAGLAYELIRYAGKHQDNRALMTLLAPGLWLQRLTTREPTLDQVEVSIRAIEEVRRREAAESPAEQASGPQGRGDGVVPRIVREADVVVGREPRPRHGRAHRRDVRRVRGARRTRCRRAIAAPEGKTSPEELLAAAHGGCFTMSLAGELTGAGTPPGRLDVHCTHHDGRGRGPGPPDRPLGARRRARAFRGVDADAFASGCRGGRTRAARSRRSCATPGSAIEIDDDTRRRRLMATDRTAKVTWRGSLMDGSRHDRGRRQRRVRPARRDVGLAGGEPDGRTSPEELIAAAWASCFSMALSHALAGAGTPPERLETSVTVTFQPGEGIIKGAITVVGTVPGSTTPASSSRPRARRSNCPVSKALTGIPEVTLDATLATAQGG